MLGFPALVWSGTYSHIPDDPSNACTVLGLGLVERREFEVCLTLVPKRRYGPSKGDVKFLLSRPFSWPTSTLQGSDTIKP